MSARDIAAVLDRYVEAFNRQDFAAARDCYALPCSFVSSDGIATLSADNFVATMVATSGSLRRKGLVRSAYTDKRVQMLGDRVAIMSCRCLRYRADGSLMAQVCGTYGVHQADDGRWRLTHVLIHGPGQPMLVIGQAV